MPVTESPAMARAIESHRVDGWRTTGVLLERNGDRVAVDIFGTEYKMHPGAQVSMLVNSATRLQEKALAAFEAAQEQRTTAAEWATKALRFHEKGRKVLWWMIAATLANMAGAGYHLFRWAPWTN